MNPFTLAIGALLAASTLGLLLLDSKRRDALLGKLHVYRRRATSAFTPPRSVSPHPTSNQSSPEYGNVFPPHRREALAELPAGSMKGPGKSEKELSKLPPNYSKLIPGKEVCNTDEFLHYTTPTGFTVEEIRRLGDFPDYATLSGIPLPSEYKDFNINTALPRPYRPFRWPYHQTMSLTKLDTDWWLELEKTYVERVKQRQELFVQNGPSVLQNLPGSELATKELMEISLQFLCARYSKHFSLDKENLVFYNNLLQTQTDLKATEPLQVLLNNIPEDFAIMLRDPDTGIYSFRAGMIMSSLGWSLGTKIGLKLHEIHGPIPDYKEKMKFSMDRYFAKKPTDKAIQRGSWGLEIDEPLYMPEGDPHEKLREAQDPNHTVDRCTLRVDWQTLRRLPLSGAIVFNFKGLFTRMTEFRDEPYVPSLVLKVLNEGKQSIMDYKNTWHTEHVSKPALEEYEREQIAKGLIEEDWEAKTLDEAPFFPGWLEKWSKQQGFC